MSLSITDPTDRIVAINKLLPEIKLFLSDLLDCEQLSETSSTKCQEFVVTLQELLQPPLPPRKSHKNSVPDLLNGGDSLPTSEEYLSKQRQLSRQYEGWVPNAYHGERSNLTPVQNAGTPVVDDPSVDNTSDTEVVYERIGSNSNSTCDPPELSFRPIVNPVEDAVFDNSKAPPVPERTNKKKPPATKPKRNSPLLRTKGMIRRAAGKDGSNPNLVLDSKILPHDLPNPQCSGPLRDLKDNMKVWCYLKDKQLYIFHDFSKPATAMVDMREYKVVTDTEWTNRFQLCRSGYPSLYFATDADADFDLWSTALQCPQADSGSNRSSDDDSDYERPLDVIAKITADKKYASESDLLRHTTTSSTVLQHPATSDDDLYLRVKDSSPLPDYYDSELVDQWAHRRRKSASHDGIFSYNKNAPLPPIPGGGAQPMEDNRRKMAAFPPIDQLDNDGYLMVAGSDANGVPQYSVTGGSSSSLSGSFESISSGNEQLQSRESLIDGDATSPGLRGSHHRSEKAEKEFQFLHDLTATYSGVLFYRRLLAVWQKRYCKVKDQTLLCYRNASLDESPLLGVPLLGYKVDLADKETWKNNSFKLTKPGCDVLYFATPSQESLRKWLSAIVKEIDRERFNLTPGGPGVEADAAEGSSAKQQSATPQPPPVDYGSSESLDAATSAADKCDADDESDGASLGTRSRSSSLADDLMESGRSKMSESSSNEQMTSYHGYMIELPAADDSTLDGGRVVWAVVDHDYFQLFEDETGSVLLLETSSKDMKITENVDLNDGMFGFEVDFGFGEVRFFRIEKQREFFVWSDVLSNAGCEVRKVELNHRKRRSLIIWPTNEFQKEIPEEEEERAASTPLDRRTDLRHRKRSDENRQSRSLDRTETEKRAMQMALHRTATGYSKKVATLPASLSKKTTSGSRMSSIFRSLTRRKYEVDAANAKQVKSIQSSNDQMPKEVFSGPLIQLVTHTNGNESRYSRHGRVSGKMFYLYEHEKEVKPVLKIALKNASLEEFVDPTQNIFRFTITSMEDNEPHVMCVRSEADVEAWMSAMVTLAFQNVRSADVAAMSSLYGDTDRHHSSDEIRRKEPAKTPLSRIQSTPALTPVSGNGDVTERKRKISKEASALSLDRRYMEGYLFELHATELSSTRVRRWCAVTSSALCVYRASNEKKCLRVLDFLTYNLGAESAKHRWSIVLHSGSDSVTLVALDKTTHAKWTDAIRQATKKRTRSGTDLNRLRTTADHVRQFLQPAGRSGSYALSSDKTTDHRNSMSFNAKDQEAIDNLERESALGISGTLTEMSDSGNKHGKSTDRHCYIREGAFVVCKHSRPDKELYRIELASVGILDESDPDKDLYQFRLDYKRGKSALFRAPDQSTAEKWMVAVSMAMLLQRLQSSNKSEVYADDQDDFSFVSLSDDWSHSDRSAATSPVKKQAPAQYGDGVVASSSALPPPPSDVRDAKRRVSVDVNLDTITGSESESPTATVPRGTTPSNVSDVSIQRASDVVTYPDRSPGPFMRQLLLQEQPSPHNDRSPSSPIEPVPARMPTSPATHAELNKLHMRKESLEGERIRLVRLMSESRQLVQNAKVRRNSSKSSEESEIFEEEFKTSKHDLDAMKKRLNDVDKEIKSVSADINRSVARTMKNTRKTSSPIAPTFKKRPLTGSLTSSVSLPTGADVFQEHFSDYPPSGTSPPVGLH